MKPSFISKEVHAARLGVKVNATREELDSAFKKMAFIFHPDRVGNDKDFAHERFVEMKESYEYLVSLLKYGDTYPSSPPPPPPSPSQNRYHGKDSSYDENIGFPNGSYVARIDCVELKTGKRDSLYVRWRLSLNKFAGLRPGDNIQDEVERIKSRRSGLDVAYKRNFLRYPSDHTFLFKELSIFREDIPLPYDGWLFELKDSFLPFISGIFVVIRKSADKQWTRIDFERFIE